MVLAAVALTAFPVQAEPTGAEPPPSPLSAAPGTWWQTDATVWAMAYSQGVVYVGGGFTTVRPPGAAPGTSERPQARLAAFDASTGDFLAGWRPVVTGGAVYSLDVSPDGDRLYVGGAFTRVDHHNRGRIAAYDITTPTAPTLEGRTGFAASVNAPVTDIDSTARTVYLGGGFTRAGGLPRSYVAAFGAQGSGVTPFRVRLSGVSAPSYPHPFVSAVQYNRGRVLVGGLFDNVNGVAQHGIAMVDATTGASTPGFTEPVLINTSFVTAAAFGGNGRLFIAGRDDKSGSRNRLEGVMALDGTSGSILWGSNQHRCLGDSFALEIRGSTVWVATHAHNCGRIGTFPESRPRFYASVLGHDVGTGEQVHFYPETGGRPAVPGSLNNARALTTDGRRLFVAGGFLSVNGLAQQNITYFSPKTDGGVAPVRVHRPQATATPAGDATVTWTTSSDRDDRSLTYEVFRRNSLTPFATVESPSAFWDRRTLSVVDTEVATGDSVFYRVRVSDGTSPVMSLPSETITVG